MNVKNVEKKEKGIVELSIEVSPEEFEAAIERAYHKNKGKINVPGFRKGKAPRKVIEGMYGKMVFYDDALNDVCPKTYQDAITEKELKTVALPTFDNVDFTDEGGLTYTASAPVYPEIVLGQYKGLEAYKPSYVVTDEDVDFEIKTRQERNARIVSVEREVKNGDTAVIDYEGFTGGEAFEGGKAEKFDLKIGSGNFIPGFEEQIIGHKAGDEFSINVKFPEDYHEELAGKDAEFKIVLHEVKESQIPDADDEFAKDVSEFDTIAELREDIKKDIGKQREEEADRRFRAALLKQVTENMEGEIPDAMVDEQLDRMVGNYEQQLSSSGISMDQYCEIMGTTREDFKKQYRKNADLQVKIDLAIAKVAELENIEVSDEEIEAEYTKLAEQYNLPVDRLKEYVPADSLKGDIRMNKASQLVVDNGVATDVEPEEEPEEDEEQKED